MMKFLVNTLLLFLLTFGAGSSLADGGGAMSLDVDAFNESIMAAIDSGAQWPSNALQITEKLFRETPRNFLMLPEDELLCSGHSHLVSVVIMRGAFSKAQGWGDWCEIHYRKVDDGTLRLCYILPMNKESAQVRSQKTPLKAQRAVQLAE